MEAAIITDLPDTKPFISLESSLTPTVILLGRCFIISILYLIKNGLEKIQ